MNNVIVTVTVYLHLFHHTATLHKVFSFWSLSCFPSIPVMKLPVSVHDCFYYISHALLFKERRWAYNYRVYSTAWIYMRELTFLL